MTKLELKPVTVKPFKGKYYRPVNDSATNTIIFEHLSEQLYDSSKPYGVSAKDIDYFKVVAEMHNIEVSLL